MLKAQSDSKMRMVLCPAKVVVHPDVEKTRKTSQSTKQRYDGPKAGPKGPHDMPKSESLVNYRSGRHGGWGWSNRTWPPETPKTYASRTISNREDQAFGGHDTP